MKLSELNPKVGDRIRIYVEEVTRVLSFGRRKTTGCVTVVGHLSVDDVTLGWKDGDGVAGGWAMDPASMQGCTRGCNVMMMHMEVIGFEKTAEPPLMKSAGMRCCGCSDFNPWAEPNTPDGKYRCYSCRG